MMTEVHDPAWDIDTMRPYVDTILEAFGPGRIMFGSDWPVSLLGGQYQHWVDTVAALISPLSQTEQQAIMGGTAARCYLGR